MSHIFAHFSMRDKLEHVKAKAFPNFENQENQRAEFLPVEWRSSLRLDGGRLSWNKVCY
jgi:hypothetical protein